jgi:hypothetical protein
VDRPRRDAPPPPAPQGPDISQQIVVTVQIGPLSKLKDHFKGLLPAFFASGAESGTQQLLGLLLQALGVHPLGHPALDLDRGLVIGLRVNPPLSLSAVRQNPIEPFLLLPVKDGPLLLGAYRSAFPESRDAAWGGVELRRGGQTHAWVAVRGRHAVVAPSGPLLDSAVRALGPLAEGMAPLTAKIRVRIGEAYRVLKPLVALTWGSIRSELTTRPLPPAMRTLVKELLPLAEKIGELATTIETLDGSLRLAADGWHWDLRAALTPGGALHRWVGKQRSPGTFGLDLLPAGAALVSQEVADRELQAVMRQLGTRSLAMMVDQVATQLPTEVRTRGLLDKARPVTFDAYRAALRDLNLADYKASFALYRTRFALRELTDHLTKAGPALDALDEGHSAYALYLPKGPGLAWASVKKVKDARKHAVAFRNHLQTTVRLLDAMLRDAYTLAPEAMRAVAGRTPPVTTTLKAGALQVGKVSVSTLAVKIRWPQPPRGAAATPEAQAGFARAAEVQKVMETLLGPGDVTFAWAHVGDVVVTAFGNGWKDLIRTAIQRAQGQPGSTVASGDPMLQPLATAGAPGRLSLGLLSFARVAGAIIEGVNQWLLPRFGGASGSAAGVIQIFQTLVQTASSATHLETLRDGNDYVVRGRVPKEDVVAGPGAVIMGILLTLTSHSGPPVRHRHPAYP